MIILFLILIFFYLRNFLKLNGKKKGFKAEKLKTLNKSNLYDQMNLTKKERYNLSKEESLNYLGKRKLLLEEIRKEYKKISRGNSKKNLK